MKLKIINKIKLFLAYWNGLILILPALIFFIISKVAITNLTGGQEQGYFWSHLNVISLGAVKLFSAELFASALLFLNTPKGEGLRILFTKLTKEEINSCSVSREHTRQLYCCFVLAAAILMAFA